MTDDHQTDWFGLPPEAVAHCQRVLGPCHPVADLSWPHGGARTVEVHAADGQSWIAKSVAKPSAYERERDAYRDWVPALADNAPHLLDAADNLRLLLISKLPGTLAESTPAATSPQAHHRAGELTRRFHQSTAPITDPGFAPRLLAKFDSWATRAETLLSQSQLAAARTELSGLATLPAPTLVPCHLDNHPRNWLVDDTGRLRLIDFGHARKDVWIQDLSRLHFGVWHNRPDLREAFLSGYGRTPTELDLAVLRCYAAYTGVSTVVWAHEHADPEFEAHGREILARSGS
ncbi:phosphotransferase enzyme family protein [Crossiella cryophila]|uniref:Ser/Thr protein kinase RdoA (MazF antagonist) n=1 Tax=Crossiella cryophila TaxID=43355 RepID=A0A7W7FXC8_9PSEU|nr:aminoglycoside phosphotransferase family protein [Crossiella cryophila]MBB4678789.1 Ser/Thr protein kinase RdoA (MazF antagonist) [Crossiella cryophila]